ncbi:MAG: hypothetical protein HYU52_00545, partial [Acidobacteria bacterium]|nr:hypothetical protein [Acidobacteriota bacterium]
LVEPAIEDRYSSATAVRRDIERGRMPRTRARRRRAALVSAAVAISVALGILITRPASDEPATWADGRAVPREPVAVAARVRETGVPPPIPDGELREVERSPVLLPEPSVPVSVRGSVRYDGRPITELTSVPPQFWLRNEATGKVATARARYQRGSFTLYGLAPGKYGVNLRFDAVAGNALGYPGDFYAWRIFDVTDGGVTEIDVDVVRIIHLTSPQDNGMILDGWGEACEARRPGFRGAMQFAWEPVSPDATYRWQLMRVGCPYTAQSEVASGATEETGIRIRLAPSRPGEFYLFNLEAERNGRRTGTLMTYGSFGHGWDYRFVVTGR